MPTPLISFGIMIALSIVIFLWYSWTGEENTMTTKEIIEESRRKYDLDV